MTQSVCVQPGGAFWTACLHLLPQFQADKTRDIKHDKSKQTSADVYMNDAAPVIAVLYHTFSQEKCKHISTATICDDRFYLSQRRHNSRVLLQLEELADEVLFCETQRLQLAEDLLKYLQKVTPSI